MGKIPRKCRGKGVKGNGESTGTGETKRGSVISYSIRVFRGRDPSTGKQLTPYTATWRVPEGWGEKRARKEAERQAVLFEKRCREGQVADGRQTFAAYAEYVLRWKRSLGLKHLTELHYRQCLQRVLPVLGAMRLGDIRPQHLNQLYETLSQPQARVDNVTAAAAPRLWREVAAAGLGPERPRGGRQEDQPDPAAPGQDRSPRHRPADRRRPGAAPRAAVLPGAGGKAPERQNGAELPRPGGGHPEPGGAGDAHPLQPRPPGHAPPKRRPPPPPITSRRRWAGSWRPCRRSP